MVIPALVVGCGGEVLDGPYRTVAFEAADGLEITADLYEGAERQAPSVLLFHQSMSSRGEFRNIGPRLQRLGYNALAVDLRWGGSRAGVVNETASRNGTGAVVEAVEAGDESPWPTIDASYQDMEAAVEWLRSTGYEAPVYALGSSFSAMLVYRLAAERDVAGVLAFSPGEYDEERPDVVKTWAAELEVPVFSFAPAGEEEMVREIGGVVTSPGSLFATGQVEGHGASILDEDPAAWRTLVTFLGHHTGGPPQRSTERVTSESGVPVTVDRYAGEGGGAVVALFHQGGGSARGEYGFLVPRLLELGFTVVAADLHGGGDRFGFPNRTMAERAESEDFTYCDAQNQVQAVLDEVRLWYPGVPVVAWGSSFSGALVLHAAARDPGSADRVLAFSPASGEPMAGCSANDVAEDVTTPLLLVRPEGEAEIPSVQEQLAVFAAAGHRTYVASPGVHGSSALNPLRVEGDVAASWAVVLDFLTDVPRTAFWTDGRLDEWEGVEALSRDPIGDVPTDASVDLLAVRGAADARFLHLQLDVGRVVTAQGMVGSLEIALDADGNGSTGETVQGLDGVDLVVVLSRPPPVGGEEVGAGVGWRTPAVPADTLLSAAEIGLLVSPTHSSDRFEVRVRRGSPLGGGVELAPGPGRVRGLVRFLQAGEVVDAIGPFEVDVLDHLEDAPPKLALDSIVPPEGSFRVLAWNVSDDLFREETGAFQRVIAALGPSVVLLDEVYDEITDEDLGRFFGDLPPVDGREWSWWLASGGGPQRTLVASSRFAVDGEPTLARLDYDAGALAAWAEGAGGGDDALAKAAFEAEAGLSATGAWLEIGGSEVLFVPVDFQSSGPDGSPADELRVLQAETLNRALSAALDGRPGAGVVVGGDFNLVGSSRPLDALVSGLDRRADLEVARALNWVDRSLITWRSVGNADAFSPGRLDLVAYSASKLEVAKAFVFDAAHLSAEDADRIGVRITDTWRASDHLPVVVDFRVSG